jgi:hypothetical protein
MIVDENNNEGYGHGGEEFPLKLCYGAEVQSGVGRSMDRVS